jgi:hypothetical protein
MNAKLKTLLLVVMIAAVLVPVISAENVYVDRNPALYEVLPTGSYGYVVFYIRAGGSAQDLNIWVGNDAKNVTFDPTYNPDRTAIEGQNPDFLKVKVLQDGVSEPQMLAAGNYTAYLQKGNGDQLEQFQFKIGGGATERVPFLGDGVSSPGERICKPVYTIIEATYGSGGCWFVTIIDKEAWDEIITVTEPWTETIEHPEVNHTVHHDAITHVVYHPEVNHTVYHEAVTHVVYHPEVNHTVHHDAVTHEQFVTDGYYYVHDHKWFWDNGYPIEKVKCSNHAEHGEGWHVQTEGCTEAYGHYETVIDVPAYDEIVVDTPAWEETIIDVPAYEEIVVDTPAYEETVIDKEGWDEIIVDVPAWTETIEHPAETIVIHHPAETHQEQRCNEMIDVTGAVQSVVNGGNYRFLFDNSKETGGIFMPDGEALLYGIVDPAPGFVKSVTISYNDGCGTENTIHASEYDVIDLTGAATSPA